MRHAFTRSLTLGLIALSASHIACSGIEKAPARPQGVRADRSLQLNVPQIMRGTIASECVLLGYQASIVRGYGLVVGLNGTGSNDIPPQLRAHMLTEMSRRGIGVESTGYGHISPEGMLDSEDTAVVIVEAVVPPGCVGREIVQRQTIPGTRFDVRVYAHPFTGTTSLEGGRLYTAELRPVQPGEILPATGSRQASAVAEAAGPIFVNPFVDGEGADAINRVAGRILNGGEVLEDMPISLRLASPSHARAELIQRSINTRFPREPGQSDQTARGTSDEQVRITVPMSYRDTPDEFVELLSHSTIRQAGAEAVANSIKRIVVDDPATGFAASWRWEALGKRALSAVQELYDYPEEKPRLAALRAGARLDDALAIPYLIDMAESASADSRRQAVRLLGDMRLDPRIDEALRGLLSDDDVDVRLAAYEAETERADPYIRRYAVSDSFILDVIECDKPMVYITQIGQPRIAVFGRDLALERPLLVDAWSGRLLVKAGANDDLVAVYYRPEQGGDRVIEDTGARLEEFIRFLGREKTIESPEPGLGLTYGETVGTIYQIWKQDYLRADFKAEQDRVLAAILRQQEESRIEQRPEFSTPPDGEEAAPMGAPDVDWLERLPEAPPLDASSVGATGASAEPDR